jgi:hypothetical protein
MALTQSQKAIVEKARSLGAGQQAIALSDAACAYLVAVIIEDLGLRGSFAEVRGELLPFYGNQELEHLVLPDVDFTGMFERLLAQVPDADTYFGCMAALHKGRLKYERILQMQAFPSFEQVGPRGLLQYGTVSPRALTPLLFWRKWFFDIDNRAAQETGYVFEPIIAAAIGGTPASAKSSPIKRSRDTSKGRQVDCIRDMRAYEFKIRVTIAASGQGRWAEELEFPRDCHLSGYTPVLIVLDPTPNDKLTELRRAFEDNNGEVFVGDEAWNHLDAMAGRTMAGFLEKYVRYPMQELLASVTEQLPQFSARIEQDSIVMGIAGEELRIKRAPVQIASTSDDEMPPDVADVID